MTLSLLLTEEMRRSTAEEGRSFSFTDCSTIIIPTPECPEEIRFVSIDDPDDLIDVPDPGHVFLTATDIMDPSWTISLKVGQNGLMSVPSNVRVLTVKAEGIDQNVQAYSDLPFLASGNTPAQQRYLALSKVRLQNARETGAAEIVMSVQGTDNFSANYPNRWSFFFDNRTVSNITWKSVLSLFATLNEGEEAQNAIERAFPNGVISKTRRQQGADGAAYEVPDVNYANRIYYFTNMKSWGLKGKNDGAAANYFPVLPLGSASYRLMLLEKDKLFPWGSYKYFSRRRKSDPWVGTVQTFDASTGSYSSVTTRHANKSHKWGSSDDVILESGVRRLNTTNVLNRMGGDLNSLFQATYQDHLYEFRTVKNRLVVQE